MDHSIIKLNYFLKRLLNYEEALYCKIKLLVCRKFKSNKELKEVVDLYTTSNPLKMYLINMDTYHAGYFINNRYVKII